MAPDSLTFLGGLLMGLASSLHCGGMCGAIASSLMFAFSPGEATAERARTLLAAQAGRVLMYVAGGAVLGGVGSAFYGAYDHAMAYLVMRWAAAVALGWIGLSVAGFAPALVVVDRFAAPIAESLRFSPVPAFAGGTGAFASGLLWGFLPCGMVYGALFYAMLSGSAVRGGAVMAGFGLGTLPSVTAVALGISSFRRLAGARTARVWVGLAIMALAAASVAFPVLASVGLCLR
ncbi:MAG: sulfite exporter TauE/SafE family protein [Hyphomicrobiales bacterium]|nr:sulfite exporter TauE/SafE family protein [Hyphomicrobiales bacterium]MBV8440616.1 sulfite exporter TauE/SafE family protein [Hyphomicrobiales bacterium]